jgi:hypothetical protein
MRDQIPTHQTTRVPAAFPLPPPRPKACGYTHTDNRLCAIRLLLRLRPDDVPEQAFNGTAHTKYAVLSVHPYVVRRRCRGEL